MSTFDPIIYANEALIYLRNALGMAKRVHMGYDKERATKEKGSVISIKAPTVFTAQDAPSAVQDLNVKEIQITLNQWKDVAIALTDQELAYTGQEIINKHVAPMAYALANKVDQDLCNLHRDVPWYVDAAGSADITNVINVHKTMFTNQVPMDDPNNLHLMVDGVEQAYMQALAAFNQQQTAGAAGLQTLERGSLGQKFNLNIFANQNVKSHVKGTCNDTALQVLGATSAGVSTINLDAVDAGVTGTLVPGDTFVIAGNTQRYAVTNTVTASANVFTGVTFVPPLAQAHADNDAVTVNLDNHTAMIGFHRDAFALAFAPLPFLANDLGAKVSTVTDPESGLSVRARMFYVGTTAKTYLVLDTLYGLKTLNPNLAVKLRG